MSWQETRKKMGFDRFYYPDLERQVYAQEHPHMKENSNPSVTPETVGQQPPWPGEGLRTPGTKDKKTEKVGDMTHEEETRIPVAPNHPTSTGQA